MNRKSLLSPPVMFVFIMLIAISLVFMIVLITASTEVNPEMTPENYNQRGAQLVAMGDAVNGEALLAPKTCATCHHSGVGSVGPAFDGIADIAATLRPGFTAEGYLLQSILDPGAYIYEGYQNVMPALNSILSDQELADIMAYLMTLHAQ
ncbi:MAG: cytochrome c [Anaerolineae bacterium]|nr:cytochrome c [Anaerolineae bacterium]